MSAAPGNAAPSGVSTCDQAWRLVRAEALGALPLYYIGALPFTFSVAWLWFLCTNDPLALRQLPFAALGATFAFIWMKTWQARYAQLLLARLQDHDPPPYGLRPFLRSAAAQTGVQSLSWIALPIALLFTIPFAWVYGFFQNATVLDDGSEASARRLAQDAMKHAQVWPKQNHIIFWLYSPFLLQLNAVYLFTILPFLEAYSPVPVQIIGYLFAGIFALICLPLCPLGVVTYVNIASAIALVFFLLKTFFAIDTVFTLAPGTLQNSASFMVAILLSGLCLDPLLKAAYVIRCFQSRAQSTGADLRIQLRGLRAATLVLAVLATALLAMPVRGQEAPAEIRAEDFSAAIEDSLENRRYNWRVPPDRVDDEAMPLFGGINRMLRGGMEWLQESLDNFGRWLRGMGGGEEGDDAAPDISGGIALFKGVLRFLLLFMSVALFIVLLAVFYRAWRMRREMVVLETEALSATAEPDLEDETTSADQLPEEGWLAMARDLQARGEHRLAIRALFLATLARLAHLGFIHIARFKSNRDYARELERRAHVVPEILQTFRDSAQVYDAVWYGAHEAGEASVDRLIANRERLRGHA